MYLEHVEVAGFRGINRLSLTLDSNTVLIGENSWGKSSLLDALTLLLSPDSTLYHFDKNDFYQPVGNNFSKKCHLQIIFTFCENYPGDSKNRRYRHLSRLWIMNNDGLHRIYFRIAGQLAEDGTADTSRTFLGKDAEPLKLHNIEEAVFAILRIYPVVRLRDARFMEIPHATLLHKQKKSDWQKLNQQCNQLTEKFKSSNNLTHAELNQGLGAISRLLKYYFSEQHPADILSPEQNNTCHDFQLQSAAWESLSRINRILAESKSRRTRLILLSLFSSLLQIKGRINFDSHARPLLVVEDPETRLHPIMLSVAMELLNQLPLQRITTTNSGELVSLMPIKSICRLVRESEKITSWRTGNQSMSQEDNRRISFHIRFNRPSSLFARCWLLVEGETEVWLLNELARQCGYHFETEGIKVIEFAQSGLRPLLKFANRMGIRWHALVDGDEAGKKYAATVRAMASQHETEHENLTILAASDMEHFLYREGFSTVYHRISAIPFHANMSPRRVIQKAIHRSSKPDLAIEVSAQAALWGINSVPLLLKKMFARILWLARGRAD